MVHAQTVTRWTAQPGLANSLKRWSWFREALPGLMQQLAQQLASEGSIDSLPVMDRDALARAFWSWAPTLANCAELEPLDTVDCAHFQVGMLLSLMLRERPMRLPPDELDAEVRLMTDIALTVLAAWLRALDAPPLNDLRHELSRARWSSYVENVMEDAGVAVAYLDLFSGREPVWNYPTMPSERPPLRRAMAQRRGAAA